MPAAGAAALPLPRLRFTSPGRHPSAASFRAHLRAVDPSLDCEPVLEDAAGPLGWPLAFRGRKLLNRFAVQPLEGCDAAPDGAPTELTLARWRNFGRSGAKLIWGGEAFAVDAAGRGHPRQLWQNPEIDAGAGLARLVHSLRQGHREIREDPDELMVGLQLTHAGRWARPDGTPRPRCAARHPALDARSGVTRAAGVVTDRELEDAAERYVDAAELAWRVGFHFVDVKCCHGNLLHELLGARSRPGRYGGDFEARTRLFRQIVSAIHSSCPELEVAVRLSAADVFPHRPGPDGAGAPLGWDAEPRCADGFGLDRGDPRRFDLSEPLRFLALLRDLDVRLVNVTLGSPHASPHLARPAAHEAGGGYAPPHDPLIDVARHLQVARRVKQAFPELCVVGSGYSYLQEWLPHVAQHELRRGHVDLVGLGRALLAHPDLPSRVLAGEPLDARRLCRTFGDCTTAAQHGLASGCYPSDPRYQALPEAGRLREIKAARRAGRG